MWTELVRAGYDHYRDGLNRLVEADFVLERFGEPYPSDVAVQERPALQDAQIVAYFLHIRARKPAGTRS